MEYIGGDYVHGDPSDVAAESMDLLQMVPDTERLNSYPDDEIQSSDHTTPRRMRTQSSKGAPQSGTDDVTDLRSSRDAMNDSDTKVTPAHICHTCSREGSIYYNRQAEYDSRNGPRSDMTRDGSVYFNYLHLANKSRTRTLQGQCLLGSGSCYEPIYNSGSIERDYKDNKKPPKPVKTSSLLNREEGAPSNHRDDLTTICCKPFLVCCGKPSLPSPETELMTKDKCKNMDDDLYGSSPYHHRPLSPSPSNSPAILNNNRARKMTEWSPVRRLLFLVGILLGILVALGGIVVGFIVLAPRRHQGEESYPAGHQEMVDTRVDIVTILPKLEQPVKDIRGWVYYTQGSSPTSGSKYIIINRTVMFSAAQKECHSRGGHLPFITSLREQIFIEEFLSQELMNPDIQRDAIGFWLGARRARGSHSGTCLYKQWKWVDMYGRSHGVVNGFTAFGIDKPDNYFNPEECLYLSYMDISPDNFLKWDDVPCDIPTLGGIKIVCEVDDKL